VINARLEGKAFSEMTESETRVAIDQIILRCSADVGCDLPFTDMFANVLSEQIILFIDNCGYLNYTLKEILLCLQINLMHPLPSYLAVEVDEVKFSGRCVNVSFMSKTLNNYKLIRNQLDRKLQNFIDGYQQ
jgi:hypothetical protein